MKKKIILLIVLSLFVLTGCNKNVKKEGTQENIEQKEIKVESNTFNYLSDIDKLPIKEVTLNNTNINNDLKKYESHILQVSNINDNIIYGDCLNPFINNVVIETKGIFTYNLETKKTNYYKYNNKKRMLDYVIKDKNIYYLEISENHVDDTFEWTLKKDNLSFTKTMILTKGRVNSIDIIPSFIKNNDNSDIYLTLINQEEKGKIRYSITKINDEKLEDILIIDNQKELLLFPNSTLKINRNILTFAKRKDNKEIVYEMNLDTKETKEIYDNDTLDSNLSEVVLTKNYYLLSFVSGENNNKGKLIVIDEKNNVTKIDCGGYKNIDILDDETAIIELGNYLLGFSLKDKKFIYKYNINSKDDTFFINNKMLVVTNKDEEIKYASLK